jgi:hypothetical protein
MGAWVHGGGDYGMHVVKSYLAPEHSTLCVIEFALKKLRSFNRIAF